MTRIVFEASWMTCLNEYRLKLQQRERNKSKRLVESDGMYAFRAASPCSCSLPASFPLIHISLGQHVPGLAAASDEELIYISRSQIHRLPPTAPLEQICFPFNVTNLMF